MKRFIAICVLLIQIGCNNSSKINNHSSVNESAAEIPDLVGTRWEFKITDNCINYYQFNADSSSICYSCASQDKYYGKYYVKGDTLYIHEYVTDTDSTLLPMDSEHRSQQAKYKLVLKNGKLKHIERWSYSEALDTWTKDNVVFREDFLFERVH
jgi:hypothetical protein